MEKLHPCIKCEDHLPYGTPTAEIPTGTLVCGQRYDDDGQRRIYRAYLCDQCCADVEWVKQPVFVRTGNQVPKSR